LGDFELKNDDGVKDMSGAWEWRGSYRNGMDRIGRRGRERTGMDGRGQDRNVMEWQEGTGVDGNRKEGRGVDWTGLDRQENKLT
jgi:hypothetical protein